MTNENYSIMDVRDLLNHLKNTAVFINTGVPEHILPDSTVLQLLLDFVEDGLCRADIMLLSISENS
ncbi:hypothetical protein HPQ32_20535 [Photobacterium carnosum]|jgi:hypothetical protein|uniref:Uncharacterized protein n=1 Tax=Bullifex porci TaxID=2606638 RepID=A0A7X2PFE9_9SPIO|nr:MULTISPECIES: hypothetical protein [Bacteria]MBY3790720.1 hypothetical protein [Photobacterium carnosum]MCD9535833.1 hypothetical protein [Photobacterium carnosum]MSU07375.1 hypothetical protein [Bullifex porci]